MTHTADSLIAFETRIADAFAAKQIRGPIHLCSDGQAEPLIDIFKNVKPEDWIFCTWRNHFHCLLKGMSEDELFNEILAGRSMFIMSEKYRIVSSAIVGGILPIALGVAMGIKRRVDQFIESQKGKEAEGSFPQFSYPKVHVFVGDMTARTGLFHEFAQYATGHGLSVRVVVENNGFSTNANTEETWGGPMFYTIEGYSYARNWPHTGLHQRVSF